MLDGRTTRYETYTVSQRVRKRIEKCFGWGKTIGGMRQTKVGGRKDFHFVLMMTGYNLIRLRNLLQPEPA